MHLADNPNFIDVDVGEEGYSKSMTLSDLFSSLATEERKLGDLLFEWLFHTGGLDALNDMEHGNGKRSSKVLSGQFGGAGAARGRGGVTRASLSCLVSWETWLNLREEGKSNWSYIFLYTYLIISFKRKG